MHLFKKALLLFIILLTASCTFTENLAINPDGAGNFSLEVDGSNFMAMAGDQLLQGMDQAKGMKNIDSTFTFKQILDAKKDSITKLSPEKQAALKKLENFVIHLKMNSDKKECVATMSTPFKKVEDLEDAMSSLKVLNDLQGKSKEMIPLQNGFGDSNTKLSFTYNKKSFTRKAVVVKSELKTDNDDTQGMAKMIFASSKYVLKYSFPKPVKKVSNTTAQFSADRKTITLEYPFTDYMDNPEKLNFEVEFEK